MYLIYRILNLVNGKSYVGQTSKTLEWRWKEHVKHARNKGRQALSRAIRKYGAHNFRISLASTASSSFQAHVTERSCIELYDCRRRGYNLTFGGEGVPGLRHTKKTKRRLGVLAKGNSNWKTNPLFRSQMGNGWKHSRLGFCGPHTKGSRAKMRASHMGVPLSAAHRKALALSHIGNRSRTGQHQSKQERLKKSLAAKAYWARKKADQAKRRGQRATQTT